MDKKSMLSFALPSLMVLLVTTVASIPRIDERQIAHDKAHDVEKEQNREYRNIMTDKQDAYQLQLNTLLDHNYEMRININNIKNMVENQ